ncbi:MAG: alpha/beta fold hydrolase [Hyphomicrobiaceae bacterium]
MTIDLQAKYDPAAISFDSIGRNESPGDWQFVWGHGWGQSKAAMTQLAQSLTSIGSHVLVDFPGFGASPAPTGAWTTADYADLTARFIKQLAPSKPLVWVGHSFGGRVGLQLASRHPQLIARLVLIAAAGLQRRRSVTDRARVAGKVYTFKALKHLSPVLGLDIERLRDRFGSADYRNAGDLRSTLTNVVREDLSDVARTVQCPSRLVYGDRDTETPPDIGVRLEQLIPDARLTVLEGQDHYSLLGDGRHLVAKRIRDFLDDRPTPIATARNEAQS